MADPTPEENARRLLQTLHSVNSGVKECTACFTRRPASQYKCQCGKISVRKPQ